MSSVWILGNCWFVVLTKTWNRPLTYVYVFFFVIVGVSYCKGEFYSKVFFFLFNKFYWTPVWLLVILSLSRSSQKDLIYIWIEANKTHCSLVEYYRVLHTWEKTHYLVSGFSICFWCVDHWFRLGFRGFLQYYIESFQKFFPLTLYI